MLNDKIQYIKQGGDIMVEFDAFAGGIEIGGLRSMLEIDRKSVV